MTTPNKEHSIKEHVTVEKLKQAYIEDEGLPEDLAAARAIAEVNRLAGRTDQSLDAKSDVSISED